MARQDMQGFAGLRACLRKPCPWQLNCRKLHVSLGTEDDNYEKITNLTKYYCSRIREVPEPAATTDDQEECALGTAGKVQGPDSPPQKDTKRKVSQGIAAEGEEVKIKEFVRGHKDHESLGGEAAEEVKEEVGGVEAVPHPTLHFI